jgi:steroid delta-isomerase-like uncharacterized protein
MSAPEITRQWVEAVNAHDAHAAADLYAPNAVVHDPSYPEPLEGRDAIRQDFESFFRAFPDLRFDIRQTISDGAINATDGSFSGTHRGPLPTPSGEIPPSGRRMELGGAGFTRLDGQGRILEEHRYYDLAGLLAQLEVTV